MATGEDESLKIQISADKGLATQSSPAPEITAWARDSINHASLQHPKLIGYKTILNVYLSYLTFQGRKEKPYMLQQTIFIQRFQALGKIVIE